MIATNGTGNTKAIYLAGILAWVIPGAGHWYMGQRSRGLIIFITIMVTFGLGILLGSVEVVDPQNSKAWFAAQICSGLPAIIDTIVQNPNIAITGMYGRGVDLGQLYTSIAGLLNFLCIMDVLTHNDDKSTNASYQQGNSNTGSFL